MAENMQEIPKIPTNVNDYLEITDATAFQFSKRLQLATQMNILGLFSSESYQIANYGIGKKQICFCQMSRMSSFGELPDVVLPEIDQKRQI